MVIGALETSIGIRLSQNSVDRLQEKIQKRLFHSLRMKRIFADTSPRETFTQVYPLVDEWFKKDALPELQGRLYRDPFSAFWFYVQTGMG